MSARVKVNIVVAVAQLIATAICEGIIRPGASPEAVRRLPGFRAAAGRPLNDVDLNYTMEIIVGILLRAAKEREAQAKARA